MGTSQPSRPDHSPPTVQQGDQALRESQRLFRSTLASWASDLLILRQAGAAQPAWTAVRTELDRAA